jgi:TonB family protein
MEGEMLCSQIEVILNCFLEPQIYEKCDIMPRFPGCEDSDLTDEDKSSCGQQKMLEFIYKNLKYPQDVRNRVEGMVVIQFIVDKDGNITNIEVVRSLNKTNDRLAVDVVSSFPKWIRVEHRGEKVNVRYTLPIRFKNSDWNY